MTPGETWSLRITGTDDPSGIDCTVAAVDGPARRRALPHAEDGEALTADVDLPGAGLYRVTVGADRLPSPLTQLVFAGPGGTRPPEG
ncbi:hypothetical protein ACWF9X_09985 [Streptomyces globisporus]